MSDISQMVLGAGNTNLDADHRRSYAVAAALEVIAARATTNKEGFRLDGEFSNLSKYADQLQEALNKAP